MAGQKGGVGNVDDLCAVVGLKSLWQDAKLSMGICNKIDLWLRGNNQQK